MNNQHKLREIWTFFKKKSWHTLIHTKCHWSECVNKLLFELIMHCVINNLKIWICMPTGPMKRTHCSQSAYHPCVNQIAPKASRPAVLVTPAVRYWTRPQVLFTEFIMREISNHYVNWQKKRSLILRQIERVFRLKHILKWWKENPEEIFNQFLNIDVANLNRIGIFTSTIYNYIYIPFALHVPYATRTHFLCSYEFEWNNSNDSMEIDARCICSIAICSALTRL
jgi:hypothetical protein